MQDALNLIHLIIANTFTFLFSAYIFDGVSLGMILVVCFIFAIMLSNLLNTPQYFKPKERSGFDKLQSKN